MVYIQYMTNQDQKEPEFCEWCGKELPANPVNIPPRFCSYVCQEDERRDWEATQEPKRFIQFNWP